MTQKVQVHIDYTIITISKDGETVFATPDLTTYVMKVLNGFQLNLILVKEYIQ